MANATGEQPTHIPQDAWKSFSYKVNAAASINDQGNAATVVSPNITGTRAMLAKVNAARPFKDAISILDIGCGPGTVYSELFDAGSSIPLSSSAPLLGIDISEPMIAQIHERQAAPKPGDESTWSRIKATIGDATNLEVIADDSQSHVLSQMGIFAVPDSDACLSEARRVMKKDGSGIFSTSAVAYAAWNSEILAFVEKLHPDRRLPRVAEVWTVADKTKEAMEKHGFKAVEVVEVPVELGYEDARKFVDGLFRMMPFLPPIIKGLTEEEIEEIKVQAAKYTAETYPGGKLPGKVNLAMGF